MIAFLSHVICPKYIKQVSNFQFRILEFWFSLFGIAVVTDNYCTSVGPKLSRKKSLLIDTEIYSPRLRAVIQLGNYGTEE